MHLVLLLLCEPFRLRARGVGRRLDVKGLVARPSHNQPDVPDKEIPDGPEHHVEQGLPLGVVCAVETHRQDLVAGLEATGALDANHALRTLQVHAAGYRDGAGGAAAAWRQDALHVALEAVEPLEVVLREAHEAPVHGADVRDPPAPRGERVQADVEAAVEHEDDHEQGRDRKGDLLGGSPGSDHEAHARGREGEAALREEEEEEAVKEGVEADDPVQDGAVDDLAVALVGDLGDDLAEEVRGRGVGVRVAFAADDDLLGGEALHHREHRPHARVDGDEEQDPEAVLDADLRLLEVAVDEADQDGQEDRLDEEDHVGDRVAPVLPPAAPKEDEELLEEPDGVAVVAAASSRGLRVHQRKRRRSSAAAAAARRISSSSGFRELRDGLGRVPREGLDAAAALLLGRARPVVHRDEVEQEVGGVELRGAREPDAAEEVHGAVRLAEEHHLALAQEAQLVKHVEDA